MAQQEWVTFKRFQEKFHSYDACREHLLQIRWPNGFCCPKCLLSGEPQAVSMHALQASGSVTTGTMMHKSYTPLLAWFWVIFLMACDKRGVSAVFLSCELEISYPTAWLLLHKSAKLLEIAMPATPTGWIS